MARQKRPSLRSLLKQPTPEQMAACNDVHAENALREQLLQNLEALAQDLVKQGFIRCPECGRIEPDHPDLARSRP